MAAYEILLLNTAIPQIQAAQSGDTYVVPRDIAFSTVASFAAGAEATPSIVATGDTNTGIWFPAADTVAISTGGISRLRLNSSGNLGLGVTPSAWISAYKGFDIGTTTSLYGRTDSTMEFALALNSYRASSGSWLYRNNGAAARYNQNLGAHWWDTAPSGTANSAVVAASTSYTVVALGTTTLAQWQASFSGLSAIPTLGQVLTSLSSPVSPIPNGGLVTQNISFTQAMTLLANGNLGIGETNPAAKLQVAGGNIRLDNNQGIEWGGGTNFIYGNNSTNILVFTTNATERARITSGGYFKASNAGTYQDAGGTYHELRSSASDVNTVFVANTSASPYGQVIKFSSASPDNNTNWFFTCEDSTTTRLYIYSDGDLANHDGVYGTISDQKLKQDIVDAGSQWDDIKAIRFRKYRMKSDVAVNPDAPALLGVVAQELEQVSPGLVDEHPDMETVEVTDEDGNVTQTQQPTGTTTKTVKSSILLMKAAVALQEAMARIEKLEAEVAALKGA